MAEETKTLAISLDDFNAYGCTHCGCRDGTFIVSKKTTQAFHCGECQKLTIVLEKGVRVSAISIGLPPEFPELGEHPRKGTPGHGELGAHPYNLKILSISLKNM